VTIHTASAAPPGRAANGDGRPGHAQRSRRRPAVVAVAAVAVMLPLLRPRGPFNSSPVDLPLVAAVTMVVLAWSQRSLRLSVPYAFPVGLLLLGGALGALTGPVPGSGLLALLQDLPVFALAATVAGVTMEASARRTVLVAWAYGSLAWAALLIVGVVTGTELLSGIGETYGSRASLTTGDPNAAANYFLLSIFVVSAAGIPKQRISRVAGVTLLMGALVLTGSNGAIVALAVGTLVATVVQLAANHRCHAATVLTVFASLLLLISLVLPVGKAWNRVVDWAYRSQVSVVHDSIGRGAQSTGSRMELLAEAEDLYTAGSMLGEGPVSTKTRLQLAQAPFAKEAHSDYTASLIERGIIGLSGLFLLLTGLLTRAWRAAVWPNAWPARATPGPPTALLGAVVAVMISAAFYEVLHFRQEWLLFGLVASAAAASVPTPQRRARSQAGEPGSVSRQEAALGLQPPSPPDEPPAVAPASVIPADVPSGDDRRRPTEEQEPLVVQVQRIWRVSISATGTAEIRLSGDANGSHRVILELPNPEPPGQRTMGVTAARALAQAVLEACEIATTFTEPG